MRKALDKEEAGTPGVRETPAGKLFDVMPLSIPMNSRLCLA